MYLFTQKQGKPWSKGVAYAIVLCMLFTCFMAVPVLSYAADDTAWEQNGVGLDQLTSQAAIVFAGDGITEGRGFLKNYAYLTDDDVNSLRIANSGTGAYPYFHKEAWITDGKYSSYDNHGTAEYHYSVISGIDLKLAAEGLGVSTQDSIDVAAIATDGYSGTVANAFAGDRYYFDDQKNQSTDAVEPVLALLKDNISGGDTIATTPVKVFAYGQTAEDDHNNCTWVKNTNKIRFGTESVALTTKVGEQTQTISVADIIRMGIYKTEYSYSKDNKTKTHSLEGIPLLTLLKNMDITVSQGQSIETCASDNYTKLIPYDNLSKWFVTYDAHEGLEQIGNATSLRMYGPGQFGNDVVVKNLSSLGVKGTPTSGDEETSSGAITTSAVKAPYKEGDNINDSVFFIAVKESASSPIKYYYYTKEELESYEVTETFTYDDHTVGKTVTAQGARLSDLLQNLTGAAITDNTVIQYLEEDGYHATAANAADYRDEVSWLTNSHVNSSAKTIPAMRAMITYGLNEQYTSPDAFNVNDPAGVYKDADNNSGYLRGYRNTGGANSSVLKYLIGVAVSYDGNLATAADGYSLSATSEKNDGVKIKSDAVIKGLIQGMKYVVRAPKVVNATLATGQQAYQEITVGAGTNQNITFKYAEDSYFYVKNGTQTTNYVYTDLVKDSVQVPDKSTNTAPYGYQRPMYYRYNGMWLSEMLKGISDIESVKIDAKGGNPVTVPAADMDKYFVAYNNTQSKTSTNIPEGKRVTKTYDDAKIIIPGEGINITGSGIEDYTAAGKDVGVLLAAAEGVTVTIKTPSSSGGTSSGGGSGGGGSSAVTTSNTTSSTADNTITSDLSKGKEGKIDLSKDSNAKAQISPSVINKLSQANKPLTIEGKGVDVKFAAKSLNTPELKKVLSDDNVKLELGAKEVTATEQIDILAKAKIGETTGLFEVGGKVVDLTAQMVKTASDKTTKTEKIETFSEPVAVTIDLSSAKLSAADIANLTGIRYEKAADGTIVPVKLGGTYNEKTKSFTFYTDRFSLYGVLKANSLKKIELKINDKNISVNGQTKEIDVAPTIMNNRTMVPVRFVAEALGAQVDWDNKTKTAEIELNGKKLSLTIGETTSGLDTPAVISNGRTLVPIRYISETLGAEVLWFSSDKMVQIVQ